jgi:hypothetical protein
VIFFPGKWVFAKFRSVKYNFDLYERLFKEKMAQISQISEPEKQKKSKFFCQIFCDKFQ